MILVILQLKRRTFRGPWPTRSQFLPHHPILLTTNRPAFSDAVVPRFISVDG
jgi:hypothetical protein